MKDSPKAIAVVAITAIVVMWVVLVLIAHPPWFVLVP